MRDKSRAIGRKRQQGAADTCTAYFCERTPNECKGDIYWNKRNLEVLEACWKRKKGDMREWEKLLTKKNANEQINYAIEKNYISYDHAAGAYDMNRMHLERLREKDTELQKIKDVGYWQFMKEDV